MYNVTTTFLFGFFPDQDGRTYPAFTRKALNNPSVKILDYSKKKRWERRGFLDDLDQRKMLDLSPSAKRALRKFGEAILNVAFHRKLSNTF